MGCVSCTGHITHTTAGGLNDRRFLSLVLGPASETQVWAGRAPPRALSLVCGQVSFLCPHVVVPLWGTVS